MNRTIKEATLQRFYYESHQQLRQHLADFVAAYNFGRRLKTLKGLTLFEYICKSWTSQPERFILNSLQQMPGLNISSVALTRSAGQVSSARQDVLPGRRSGSNVFQIPEHSALRSA
jgi:hypothetical protein